MQKILPPTLFLFTIILMVVLQWLLPSQQWIAFPYNLIGLLPLAIGLALSIQGSRQFSQINTNIKTFNDPDLFVTDGVFRISRNPMYLGMVIALLGIAMITGTVSALLLAVVFFIVTDRWYIAFEEAAMQRKFGERYTDYRSRVRRWV